MTGKQRAYLRSMCNEMDPILLIGKGGIEAPVIKQLDDALEARELIKVKVLETAGLTAREAADIVSGPLGADVIQVIGSKFCLYRRSVEKPRIELI